MAVEGKAIGISSILYNAIAHPTVVSMSLISGMIVAGKYVQDYLPAFVPTYPKAVNNSIFTPGSTPNSISSGFLLGAGASLGHGCTSGHMVCGLSRLRYRSLIATAVFSISAAVTTALIQNAAPVSSGAGGFSYDHSFPLFNANKRTILKLVIATWVNSYFLVPYLARKIKQSNNKTLKSIGRFVAGFSSGFQFGLGLLISGMATSSKVLGFLNITSSDKFDPSLLAIPLSTIIPNILYWSKFIPRDLSDVAGKEPLLEDKYDLAFGNSIDPSFLAGNALFGIGWGLSGICPATGILAALFNGKQGIYWLLSFLGGYYAGTEIQKVDKKKD